MNLDDRMMSMSVMVGGLSRYVEEKRKRERERDDYLNVS